MNPSASWCKLPTYSLLKCSGADATAFLQGQLTSNVQALPAGFSQYSGYCTPKGRLLASFLLWQQHDNWFLLLPRELCDSIRKRLSMFVLRSKVTITDISNDYTCFGVSGTGIDSIAATLVGIAPRKPHEVAHATDITVLHLPIERYLMMTNATKAVEVQNTLAAASAEQPATIWEAWNIRAGVPVIYPSTQEQFVPQTVNFDLIGAVSFDKGCYPGQEIVARTHYLGKLKQRMMRARIDAETPPQPGDKLYSTAHGDQANGMVVNAVPTRNGAHDVLAVVQQTDIGTSDVHWKTPDGAVLTPQPLPYELK